MSVLSDAGSVREAIVTVGEHWSTAQLQLVRLIVELDDSREWALDGAATCAHWVAEALHVEVCTAREWLRIGRMLSALPVIDAAFDRRDLSYSKVRALTRVATPENEAELCEIARHTPAARLGHALAMWLSRHETPEQTEARHGKATYLVTNLEPDGMLAGSFRLPPYEGGRLLAALDARLKQYRPRASADASMRWPSIARQRAEAMVELVTQGGAKVETELVIHVRADGCTLDDGSPIADSLVERIAPASFLRALIHDAERRPINASGRHRYPTPRQKRVVHERDRQCPCGATMLLQYHHDPPFDDSKRTVVDELWLRCPNCHRNDHPEWKARDG